MAESCAELIEPDVPALINPSVIIGVVPGHNATGCSSQHSGLEPYDGRLEQMSMQNIDLPAAQETQEF
jgi:hypothetical protein